METSECPFVSLTKLIIVLHKLDRVLRCCEGGRSWKFGTRIQNVECNALTFFFFFFFYKVDESHIREGMTKGLYPILDVTRPSRFCDAICLSVSKS